MKRYIRSTSIGSSVDSQSIESKFMDYLRDNGWEDEIIEYAYEAVPHLSDIDIHDAAELIGWLEEFAWAGDVDGILDRELAKDWAGDVYRAVFKDL